MVRWHEQSASRATVIFQRGKFEHSLHFQFSKSSSLCYGHSHVPSMWLLCTLFSILPPHLHDTAISPISPCSNLYIHKWLPLHCSPFVVWNLTCTANWALRGHMSAMNLHLCHYEFLHQQSTAIKMLLPILGEERSFGTNNLSPGSGSLQQTPQALKRELSSSVPSCITITQHSIVKTQNLSLSTLPWCFLSCLMRAVVALVPMSSCCMFLNLRVHARAPYFNDQSRMYFLFSHYPMLLRTISPLT